LTGQGKIDMVPAMTIKGIGTIIYCVIIAS
jgi:hypothetical protein